MLSENGGIPIAVYPTIPTKMFDFDQECLKMETEDRLKFQQKALEALRESSKTLEIAQRLLEVGNVKEAERLRDEAREQRNVSMRLMAQAHYRPILNH
jgi:hypothetical protein